MPLNVYRYLRVSSEQQTEGTSLQEQRRLIEAFCERKDLAIAGDFEDVETAAKAGRTQFSLMLKALRQGKAQGVVFHKVDRSSRNYRDWLAVSDLMDGGVYVAFAAEGLESKDPSGRFTMDILAATAVHYIRNLRQEVQKGMRGRINQGLWPRPAPFGYLNSPPGTPKEERCLKQPDPQRAPLLTKMFELYATGEETLETLAAEMKRRGLRTRAGKPLPFKRLAVLLDNPFYAGFVQYQGQLYPGKQQPLIPLTLWKRVRALREAKGHPMVSRHEHRLRQLLDCGLCGRTLTPEIQKGHTYYRCHNSEHVSTCIREEAVETAIRHDFKMIQFSAKEKELLQALVSRLVEKDEEERVKERQRLNLVRNCLEAERKRAVEGYLRGVLDEATYRGVQSDLTVKTKEVEEQAAAAEESSTAEEVGSVTEMFELLDCAYSSAEIQQQRQIIRSAYSNLVVRGKNVTTEPRKWLAAVLKRREFSSGAAGGS